MPEKDKLDKCAEAAGSTKPCAVSVSSTTNRHAENRDNSSRLDDDVTSLPSRMRAVEGGGREDGAPKPSKAEKAASPVAATSRPASKSPSSRACAFSSRSVTSPFETRLRAKLERGGSKDRATTLRAEPLQAKSSSSPRSVSTSHFDERLASKEGSSPPGSTTGSPPSAVTFEHRVADKIEQESTNTQQDANMYSPDNDTRVAAKLEFSPCSSPNKSDGAPSCSASALENRVAGIVAREPSNKQQAATLRPGSYPDTEAAQQHQHRSVTEKCRVSTWRPSRMINLGDGREDDFDRFESALTSKLNGETRTKTSFDTSVAAATATESTRPGAYSITSSEEAGSVSVANGRDVADKCPARPPDRRSSAAMIAGGAPVPPEEVRQQAEMATSREDSGSSKTTPRSEAVTQGGFITDPLVDDGMKAFEEALNSKLMADQSAAQKHKLNQEDAPPAHLDRFERALTCKLRLQGENGGISPYLAGASSGAGDGRGLPIEALEASHAPRQRSTNVTEAQKMRSIPTDGSRDNDEGNDVDSFENAITSILKGNETMTDQEVLTSENGFPCPPSSRLGDNQNREYSNDSSFRIAELAAAQRSNQPSLHHSTGTESTATWRKETETTPGSEEFAWISKSEGDLAVAIAVNEDDFQKKRPELPQAIEFDPDAKPPFYRNRRFRATAVGVFVLLIAIAIGCGVGIAKSRQEKIKSNSSDPKLWPHPTQSPTSYREGLGILSKIEEEVGTEALADPNSAYSKALHWITFNDPMQLSPEATNFIQRFFCASIYYAVNGPSWSWCKEDASLTGCAYFMWTSFEDERKKQARASRWLSNSSECEWAGNRCTSGGEIKQLQLRRFNLSGTLPDGILKLSSLEKVDLAENYLDGTLPRFLNKLTRLTSLRLRGNHFTGPIPEEWWELRNLKFFDIRGVGEINGFISTKIGQLKQIKEFWINDNRIGGTIPTEIGELQNITRLHLEQNLLEGTLPKTLGFLSNAEELFVNNNRLSGALPPEIGQMTSLFAMHASDNMLSGQLPESLWNSTSLKRLYLSNNRFNGTISSSIQRLSRSLKEFRIRDNQVTGRIPPEMGSLSMLSELSLQLNLLTGEVPNSLCKRNDFQFVLKALEVDCAKSRLSDLTEVECPQGCCTWCCDSDGDCCDPVEEYCD